MPQTQKTHSGASQNVILLSDDKIIISRALLREILGLLLFTTPLMDGGTRAPERHWSAIKSMRLYRAKKLIRQALADSNHQRGNV